MRKKRIIFITGTDTGVGKTLLTGLLLRYARQQGIRALAMKPFCSGGMEDIDFLQQIQGYELSLEEVNPFYFAQPVAPYAAQKKGKRIHLDEAIAAIKSTWAKCELLLVEGVGGVLVPLDEDYFVADLIAKLPCSVVLVAQNKLGIINHTLLSVEALKNRSVKNLHVVVMGQRENDPSTKTNLRIIRELTNSTNVTLIPFLGKKTNENTSFSVVDKKIKKALAQIIPSTYFPPRSFKERKVGKKKFEKAVDR